MRHFYGDIEGHFWTAIQESTDFEELGAIDESITTFHYCLCCCEIKDGEDLDAVYCTSCYDSFEEHMEHAIDSEDGRTWFVEQDSVEYNFEKSDEGYIKLVLEDLYEEVRPYTKTFRIIKSGQSFTYTINIPKDLEEDVIKKLARWCIGKLVLHAIKKIGHCYVTADI